jgi:hypothetical protein
VRGQGLAHLRDDPKETSAIQPSLNLGAILNRVRATKQPCVAR